MKRIFWMVALATLAARSALGVSVYYEGRLLSASGAVRPNVTATAAFRLYDAPTAGSGLSETVPASITTDASGYFATRVTLPATGSTAGTVYLGATVDGIDIQPRMKMTPAPLAVAAARAAGFAGNRYVVNGSATVGRLSVSGTLRVGGTLTLGKDATLAGNLSGFSDLYIYSLSAIAPNAAVSLLQANGPTGDSYDSVAADYEVAATDNGAFDYNQTAGRNVSIDRDGFATIWARASLGRDTDSYYGNITIKVSNSTMGNITIANDRSLHDTGDACRIFTFPVRRGDNLYFEVRTHRDLIFYNVRAWAKLKLYYFGKN